MKAKYFKRSKIVSMTAICSLAVGCAHTSKVEQRLNDKLAANTSSNVNTLNTQSANLVENLVGVTEVQKSQLRDLHSSTHNKINAINDQAVRLRALLIEDVVAPQYNEVEAELIKTRLSQLEDKKIGVIFEAIDKTNLILGREAARNQKFLSGLFEFNDKKMGR